ncbi:histidine phosphatase family protein [Bacillus timonensis]|nr:histidine phosphatase family protein [Bacillus timonensis]
MEILLIRHGQSEADFPLTNLGEVQARRMAQYVKEHHSVEFIWTSPLKRAYKTAEILQKHINCKMEIERDLMEFNNGVLAGVSKEEAKILYPLPEGGRRPHERIQNGESEIEFRLRAEHIFSKIMSQSQSYNRIAIVSHGGMISNILKSYLQLPMVSDYGFPTDDTGIHLLRIDNKRRLLMYLNKTEHLVGL